MGIDDAAGLQRRQRAAGFQLRDYGGGAEEKAAAAGAIETMAYELGPVWGSRCSA
jgi:hypothetical protein